MKFMLLLFQILGCGAFVHRASLNSKSFELNLFQNKGSSVKAKGGKSVESEAAIAKFRVKSNRFDHYISFSTANHLNIYRLLDLTRTLKMKY